jgi:hypothetical protein
VNGRVIVEMVANYSPYIEPLRCDSADGSGIAGDNWRRK